MGHVPGKGRSLPIKPRALFFPLFPVFSRTCFHALSRFLAHLFSRSFPFSRAPVFPLFPVFSRTCFHALSPFLTHLFSRSFPFSRAPVFPFFSVFLAHLFPCSFFRVRRSAPEWKFVFLYFSIFYTSSMPYITTSFLLSQPKWRVLLSMSFNVNWTAFFSNRKCRIEIEEALLSDRIWIRSTPSVLQVHLPKHLVLSINRFK